MRGARSTSGGRWRRCWAALLVGPCLLATPARARPAQAGAAGEPPPLVEVRLSDGSVVYGIIEEETADRLVVRTVAGATVDVPRAEVVSVAPAEGRVVAGRFWRADSNATRLLFAPTGRSLDRGEGYVGVYEFLLPFVQVGVTDRLTLGAGTPLIFFGDESGRPVWVTPKYQFYRGARVRAAAGVMHFLLFGEDSSAGLAYAVATAGSNDTALSIGAGWAYARYRENDYSGCSGRPLGRSRCMPVQTRETVGSGVLMVGGERRVHERVKLLTENYVFQNGGIVSAGVRFLGDRLSADLGIFAPITGDGVVALPIVNFVWTFGR